MREIQLTRGLVAKVDDADYEWLSQWKWYAKDQDGYVYAARCVKKKTVYMHVALTGGEGGVHVDHEDHDGLNNQRDNLRPGDVSDNSGNRVKTTKKKCTSVYKGVYWSKSRQRWSVRVTRRGVVHWCGYFEDEADAARAYDRKAIEVFGDRAKPNFPRSDYKDVGEPVHLDAGRQQISA